MIPNLTSAAPPAPALLANLRDDIAANPALLALAQAGDDRAIADHYNAAAEPPFWVRKSRLARADVQGKTSPDGTVFNFSGVGYTGRQQGDRDGWRDFFDMQGNVDASQGNFDQAIRDFFSGPGNAAANVTHIFAMARRRATVAERLLAVGDGSTTSHARMTAEGALSVQEASLAREGL